MRHREPACEADPDLDRLRRRHRLGQPAEGLAAHELGHQIRVTIDFTNSIDRHDVRVLESCSGAGLDEKTLPRGGVRHGNEPHGNVAIEEVVEGEMDYAEPAAAKGPEEAVFSKLGGRDPVRGGQDGRPNERSAYSKPEIARSGAARSGWRDERVEPGLANSVASGLLGHVQPIIGQRYEVGC